MVAGGARLLTGEGSRERGCDRAGGRDGLGSWLGSRLGSWLGSWLGARNPGKQRCRPGRRGGGRSIVGRSRAPAFPPARADHAVDQAAVRRLEVRHDVVLAGAGLVLRRRGAAEGTPRPQRRPCRLARRLRVVHAHQLVHQVPVGEERGELALRQQHRVAVLARGPLLHAGLEQLHDGAVAGSQRARNAAHLRQRQTLRLPPARALLAPLLRGEERRHGVGRVGKRLAERHQHPEVAHRLHKVRLLALGQERGERVPARPSRLARHGVHGVDGGNARVQSRLVHAPRLVAGFDVQRVDLAGLGGRLRGHEGRGAANSAVRDEEVHGNAAGARVGKGVARGAWQAH
mmetsp:Transcript_14975/g.56403  ORF Transcript_14975/g.56403 Transcript_14975/m.56403 type:complete len:345 (+) Transcript_14975:443-1477(+)